MRYAKRPCKERSIQYFPLSSLWTDFSSKTHAYVEKAKADLEKEASLDELLVRKELEDSFCRYNLFYENFDSFPEWARKTLNSHRHDQRNYVYILEELEAEDI